MRKRALSAALLVSVMLASSCDLLPAAQTEQTEESRTVEETLQTEVFVPAETSAATIAETAVQTAAPSEQTDPTSPSEETEVSQTEISSETEYAGTPLSSSEQLAFFASHADTYLMSSGAGGWSAHITVNPNGTFDYNYHDFDAGVYYICHAQGQLGSAAMIDDNTYTVQVESMTFEFNEGDEWSETDNDGSVINYAASDSYGIHEGDTLYYYIAGADSSALPEGYLIWYAMPRALALENIPGTFPLSGYYNPQDDCAYIEDDYE